MIIKVHKYLIFGAKEDLDLFYERAQMSGYIEFISPHKKVLHLPDPMQKLLRALKVLKEQSISSEKVDPVMQDPLYLAKEILDLKEAIDKQEEERRIIEMEKARISPFGDFFREDIEYIQKTGHLYIQFFCAKSGTVEHLETYEGLIHLLTENGLDYYVSLSKHIINYPFLNEVRIERTVHELDLAAEKTSRHIQEQKAKLHKLASYKTILEEEYVQRMNVFNLATAKEDAEFPWEEQALFSVEAWIPENRMPHMVSLLEGLAIECEKIAIEEKDRVPTSMENKGTNRIGEDLVRFYDTPSTTDKDPSGWLFWAFALFFAIIVADAGYGLLFLGLSCYAKWKWKTFHGIGKRIFRLFVTLSLFVVGWGVMTSSFFGIDLSFDNPLRKIAPFTYLVEAKAQYHLERKDDVYKEYVELTPGVAQATTGEQFMEVSALARKDFADSLLLEIALIIGIVHIGLGMIRYLSRNFSNIGWAIFLPGAYLFFPQMLEANSIVNIFGWISVSDAHAIGGKVMCVGFSLALLLGIIQKKWKGLLEIMNVIQIGADVLSYLRLYALAIASSIMAVSFNDMGEMAGVVGGSLIILIGHLTNMSLGTMSGVIHGLRLNVIEWYRYSFEGGGKAFNPLKILKLKEE